MTIEDARLGVVLEQPLGDEHHQDALAAALRVPDDAALALRDTFLRRFHAEELVRPRHLLLAGVEDHEVADQVEQARLVTELRQRPVEQRSSRPARCDGSLRGLVLPLHEELLRRAGGAVAQALRIAARQHQLHRAEEALVEDLFLIGNELAHAVGQLHRAAFELDHRDGDPVHIEHDVGPPLVSALERHLLGQREVVLLRVLPIDQINVVVRLAGRNLHLNWIAQELVRAQVRLVERDAGGVGGGLQLLQRRGDVGGGVAARRQVVAKNPSRWTGCSRACSTRRGSGSRAIGLRLVREQADDAVLRLAFGARGLRHGSRLWTGCSEEASFSGSILTTWPSRQITAYSPRRRFRSSASVTALRRASSARWSSADKVLMDWPLSRVGRRSSG